MDLEIACVDDLNVFEIVDSGIVSGDGSDVSEAMELLLLVVQCSQSAHH